MAGTQTRVVVIGAGYAGLLFTTRLAAKAPRGTRITLVKVYSYTLCK
jgi:NADH dehydrogenase FAD-containing subunit